MARLTTLHDLFVKELRDTYDAEKQISKALPKMVKHAHREDLRKDTDVRLTTLAGSGPNREAAPGAPATLAH